MLSIAAGCRAPLQAQFGPVMHRQMVHLLPAMVWTCSIAINRLLVKPSHMKRHLPCQSHEKAPAMSIVWGGTCHVSLLPCILMLAGSDRVLRMLFTECCCCAGLLNSKLNSRQDIGIRRSLVLLFGRLLVCSLFIFVGYGQVGCQCSPVVAMEGWHIGPAPCMGAWPQTRA